MMIRVIMRSLGEGSRTCHIMPIEALKTATFSPPPLRKKNLQQQVYTRPRGIEDKLKELLVLPRAEILSRCEVLDREASGHIPSECLVHLLRASKEEAASTYFEILYKTLFSRLVRRLRPTSSDGNSEAFQACLIRDKVLDRFHDLLASDRNGYEDKLDFYEVRFDLTLKRLILDAQDQVWTKANRSRPLENLETNEISAEVEKAAGSFDPFADANSNEKNYRSRLDAAINSLPTEQKRIVTMIKMGIPIDSKDPEVVTIAKALNRSEKTIRTTRDKAFASIRTFFKKGVMS